MGSMAKIMVLVSQNAMYPKAYHLQKHVATVLLEHYAKMCGQTIEYLYLKRPFWQKLGFM